EKVVDVQANVLERLRELGHIAHKGFLALEVAAKLRAPAAMPDRIIGEQLSDRLEVAALEGLESVTNTLDLLVEAELNSGFRHVRPPLSPSGSTRPLAGDDHSSGPTIGRSVAVSRGTGRRSSSPR